MKYNIDPSMNCIIIMYNKKKPIVQILEKMLNYKDFIRLWNLLNDFISEINV